MSKELEQLRNTQSNYIKHLDYLPKLDMVMLLKECYYGSLANTLGGTGWHVDNLVFKTQVYNSSVEVEIYIQHPEDWKRKLTIRHFTQSEGRSPTYYTKSLFGKWDKHLEVAVGLIRQGQIRYVQNKLTDIETQIAGLTSQLDKEKEEFEALFD